MLVGSCSVMWYEESFKKILEKRVAYKTVDSVTWIWSDVQQDAAM
jgi:hypothetical protein